MIKIFTDGSSKGNPGPGGYGIILQHKKKKKELFGGFRTTTNNRMELLAVITGLEAIKTPGWKVLVVSDSRYVIDPITKGWLKNWVIKDFKGKKNKDLWNRYLKVAMAHDVQFQWVKGHNGYLENERCDYLAVKAAEGHNLKVDTDYENSINKSRILVEN